MLKNLRFLRRKGLDTCGGMYYAYYNATFVVLATVSCFRFVASATVPAILLRKTNY